MIQRILKLILIIISFGLTQCKNEKTVDQDLPLTDSLITAKSDADLDALHNAEFVGRWGCTKVDVSELLNSAKGDALETERINSMEDKIIGNSYLLFNADKSCEALVADETIFGTWEFDINNSTLELTKIGIDGRSLVNEFKVLNKEDDKMQIKGGHRKLGFEFERQ